MKLENISIKNLAILISDHLRKNGVDTVLTGGACVTIYTRGRHISYDLDFVPLTSVDRRTLRTILEELGFEEEGRHFVHEGTQYFIEFIAPPLAVGEEPVKEIHSIKKGNKVLKLLSPTDCTKDRLAAYYHWNDRQSLEQAILVCTYSDVDVIEVERWSKNEGMKNRFEVFRKLIGDKHSR